MNTTTTGRRFTLYTVVSVIVNGFMLMAAGISYSHIVHTSARLGVTSWQTYLVPAFVDGLAILGMIGRSEAMARQLAARGHTAEEIEAVKRFGFWLQLTAGTVSLAANFYAGETLGDQLFGLLVVGGFVVTEKYSEKLRSVGAKADAKTDTAADVQAAVDAAIAETLAQAAIATQAAIAAAVTEALAADADRRRKAEQAAKRRERDAAKRLAEIAPVSPAVDGVFDAALGYAPAYA